MTLLRWGITVLMSCGQYPKVAWTFLNWEIGLFPRTCGRIGEIGVAPYQFAALGAPVVGACKAVP